MIEYRLLMPTPVPVPLERVSLDTFKKLELRVADILEVQPHPNADRLWVLTIRVGEACKQVVAGIRGHYDAQALAGKSVIVVNNIEPAVIRGVESQGMLLAASSGEVLSLIVPERPMASGSPIR